MTRLYGRGRRTPHEYAAPIAAFVEHRWASLPIIGDLVLTPTGRIAMVRGYDSDGRCEVRYREHAPGVQLSELGAGGSELADIFPKYLRPAP